VEEGVASLSDMTPTRQLALHGSSSLFMHYGRMVRLVDLVYLFPPKDLIWTGLGKRSKRRLSAISSAMSDQCPFNDIGTLDKWTAKRWTRWRNVDVTKE